MIPKILHFLWFGKSIPGYAWRVANMYKKVNPGFTVNLVYEEDVKNAVHPDVAACYSLVQDKRSKYYRVFNGKHFEGTQLKSAVVFNTAFSDAFRFYLLDRYGGIYLDLDTWPVKPFDDKLLGKRYFHMGCDWGNGKGIQPDSFFIGSDGKTETGPDFMQNELPVKAQILSADIFRLKSNFDIRKRLSARLINKEIEYGESLFTGTDVYVNHLNLGKQCNWFSEKTKVKKQKRGLPPSRANATVKARAARGFIPL